MYAKCEHGVQHCVESEELGEYTIVGNRQITGQYQRHCKCRKH